MDTEQEKVEGAEEEAVAEEVTPIVEGESPEPESETTPAVEPEASAAE